MKYVVASLLILTSVFAKKKNEFDITVHSPKKGTYKALGHIQIRTSKESLKEMVSKSDQFCTSCQYYMPNVDQIEIIKTEENTNYTWTFVDSFIKAAFFNKSTITDTPFGFVLETKNLSEKEISELMKISGRESKPIFHYSSVKTTVTEVFKESDSLYLDVTYEMEMKTDNGLVNSFFGKKKALEGLRDAAEATFKNYKTLE